MHGSKRPVLSVVVVMVGDTLDCGGGVSQLTQCLKALAEQIDPPRMEILVPYRDGIPEVEQVQRRFPDVFFLRCNDLRSVNGGGSREHHDELRSRGTAAARGEIIGFLEDFAFPNPRWCAHVVEEHQQSYACIGGAIENGVDRPLNWAVYFCDYGRYQNPVPAGESLFASDSNVSYKRSALEAVRPVWEKAFNEASVNAALVSRGEKLALSPRMAVDQCRHHLRLGPLLKERFIWGRSYAAVRTTLMNGRRVVYAALSPALPVVLLSRMTVNVVKKNRSIPAFLKALPLTTMLTVSWCGGELIGYLTGRANDHHPAAEESFASSGTYRLPVESKT